MKNGLFKLQAFDWIKGAIVSVFVAILTYIQQLFTDGGHISIKMIITTSITALIGYLIKQLMTDDNGVILSMVGGRKKRKKPTGLPQFPNMEYTFEGSDFAMTSVVTYTSDLVSEYPISVVSIYPSPLGQIVIFNEQIQFNDFETLYFEIEVD